MAIASAICGRGVVVVCYGDDLLVFEKEKDVTEILNRRLSHKLIMMGLGTSVSFLGIAIKWKAGADLKKGLFSLISWRRIPK